MQLSCNGAYDREATKDRAWEYRIAADADVEGALFTFISARTFKPQQRQSVSLLQRERLTIASFGEAMAGVAV